VRGAESSRKDRKIRVQDAEREPPHDGRGRGRRRVRCLLIPVNGVHGKCRQADRKVFRALGSGGAVADPLAAMHNHGLFSVYIEGAGAMFHALPRNTSVNSSNSGVCPGSCHPLGLRMCAMLVWVVAEFTRPINSSISLGLLPAASIRAGLAMTVGMVFLRQCPF